jgi:peroxiredoxin Q/BCP
VLGVSPDSVKRQAKFKDKENLPFTLLADENHQVADQYGVWVEKSMYGKKYWGVDRSTFLIDPQGTIQHIFRKVKPKTHSEQVLAALGSI